MSIATDRYEELEMETSALRAIARRLRDEGDIGIAAETDYEAAQLEEQMEAIFDEEMTAEEQALYAF
ncbi:hypothetical protein M2103_000622 [Ereboglobus sp. PH5-5]|uniref:hypothetical protein n=1 Tax=Ereboglobus sp. PH5-5 TaxID=2940529 RepID=UPI002406B929|nr:hypothetical protein [Ereboglobus sp. PH5-5]MDF9832412.1 hypothetical protein [Ereboglobus sp. PH5-5]